MRRSAFLLGLWLSACAPPTLRQQMLNGEAQATRAEKALDEAEAAYAKYEPDDAEDALEEAKKALADPDVELYPEREAIHARYQAVSAKLPQAREAKRLHDIEVKSAAHWAEADQALLKLNGVLDTVGKEQPVETEVETARDAAMKLKSVLEDGEDLEKDNAKYQAYAQKNRLLLAKHLPRILLDVARVEFVRTIAPLQAEGRGLLDKAKAQTNLKDKKGDYEDAVKAFTRCGERGEKQIEEFNPLRTASVVTPSGRTTVQALLTQCNQGASRAQQQVATLEKTLARLEKAQAKKPSQKPAPKPKSKPRK